MIYMQKGWYFIVNERKTSVFSNGLLWFGAGISIAEILTGMLLAPLGFAKAFAAIILGHLIGGTVMYLAGLIGGRTGGSAMETVRISFGTQGAKLFAGLNVIQLVGWTAVMVASAALAANTIAAIGVSWWSLIIGAFIALWIVMGLKNLSKVNVVVMAALFILTIVLSLVVFKGGTPQVPAGDLTFGGAVELAVAMPLSWLPLISDYTREAEKPFAATLSSTLTYGVVSCWMYVIGMGAAIFTGEGDIALIMVKAGLGVAALLILILSTVTTTFLDAYSAGISAESLSKKINGKYAALIVTVIGTICAICFPMDDITNFLYLIGSVFAPMIAIQITDFFLLKRGGASGRLDVCNAVVWVLGFVLYRVLMTVDIPVGNTLPDMAATMLLCVIAHKLVPDKAKAA